MTTKLPPGEFNPIHTVQEEDEDELNFEEVKDTSMINTEQ
jgi:hypothetical protein